MNTYRSLDIVAEHHFGPGDFEHDFTPADEADWLGSGHVELVPRKYRVLSANYEAGPQGSEVELALRVEIEAALMSGGHIERVEASDPPAGNASREEWAAYALATGASEEDLTGEDGKPLGRDELRDIYGPKREEG